MYVTVLTQKSPDGEWTHHAGSDWCPDQHAQFHRGDHLSSLPNGQHVGGVIQAREIQAGMLFLFVELTEEMALDAVRSFFGASEDAIEEERFVTELLVEMLVAARVSRKTLEAVIRDARMRHKNPAEEAQDEG